MQLLAILALIGLICLVLILMFLHIKLIYKTLESLKDKQI